MTYNERCEALNRRQDRTILALVDLPNCGTRRMLENDLKVILARRKELLDEELAKIVAVCEASIHDLKAELAGRADE